MSTKISRSNQYFYLHDHGNFVLEENFANLWLSFNFIASIIFFSLTCLQLYLGAVAKNLWYHFMFLISLFKFLP